LFGLSANLSVAQVRLQIVEQVDLKGKIRSVSPGVIVMVDDQGKEYTFKIQERDEPGVSLAGAEVIINFPAVASLQGQKKVDDLKAGELVQFTGYVNRFGATDGELTILESVADDKTANAGLEVVKQAPSAEEFSECVVTGQYTRIANGRLFVTVPKTSVTSRTKLTFELGENAVVNFASDDYRRAAAGDTVTRLIGAKINTGDWLIKRIDIEAGSSSADRSRADDELLEKYRDVSDEPKPPRDVRSRYFLLHTDISDRQAKILLEKLERMVALVSAYFGATPGGMIECYVVRDWRQWPPNSLDERGLIKIARGEGVTISQSLGSKVRSIVFSCDKHGVVQHEAIHAYCTLTFGSTGPTWYAEGMAELGNYWTKGNLEVDIDPVVIDYLKNAEKKELLDIVATGQITGDSWQAYAWRWALCHMLAYNPNYAPRFKTLGLAMMKGVPGATFEQVYGDVAAQISFEYNQFTANVDNGYRADLCAWDWKQKFSGLAGDRRAKTQIKAAAGWQPTGITLEPGIEYQGAAVGEWKIRPDGDSLTGAGDKRGRGRMVGVVMNNYQLGTPFVIGALGEFSSRSGGDLYVRCEDSWTSLHDNDGEITLWLRRKPSE